MSHTQLHLFKENFKFSSAHFLIFDSQRAERLHGHNYSVRVDLETHNPTPELGYSVDFTILKKQIKTRLDQWDERVLLPGLNAEMRMEKKAASLHVHFRDRYYVFPADEVVTLPITNTSVENLSKLLGEQFFLDFQSLGITSVRVSVEETKGQAASTCVKSLS